MMTEREIADYVRRHRNSARRRRLLRDLIVQALGAASLGTMLLVALRVGGVL